MPKPEKWQTREWYLLPEKPRAAFRVGAKKASLAYGNIIFKDDKFYINDFSLKYTDIKKVESYRKKPFIIIHCLDGNIYWLMNIAQSGYFKMRDSVFLILSEKIKQYKGANIIDVAEFLKDIPKFYKEISFNDLMERTGLKRPELMQTIETLILNGDIKAEIKGDILALKTESVVAVSETPIHVEDPQSSSMLRTQKIRVLRGGDWKIEGNQSVFYYKVKVKNDSQFLIGNIQIILTSIPSGLEAKSNIYKIDALKPVAFESPTFKLNAKESCVGDTIEGLVTYIDSTGNQQNVQIEPFEICYVCNLLVPKEITREEFEKKVDFMEEKKLIIDSDLDVSALESRIAQIVKNCNFALLQEMQDSQSETLKKLDAFAQGMYDKQDVALSVTVKKMEEGSKLVVKAMSDRSEKVTDLLRDFNGKLDDIKSDTELIKEYTSQIEDLFDELGRLEDIEAYLKDHLGSDWEKLKYAWQDYKAGEINRKQLIWQGVKVVGKRFIPKILAKVVPFISSK